MNCGVNNWCLSKYEEALSIYSPESSPTLFMCFWEFERKQRKIEFRFPVTIEYLCSGGKYFHRSDCLALRKRSLLYALMWHHFVIAFEWKSSKKAEKYSKLNLRCQRSVTYMFQAFSILIRAHVVTRRLCSCWCSPSMRWQVYFRPYIKFISLKCMKIDKQTYLYEINRAWLLLQCFHKSLKTFSVEITQVKVKQERLYDWWFIELHSVSVYISLDILSSPFGNPACYTCDNSPPCLLQWLMLGSDSLMTSIC